MITQYELFVKKVDGCFVRKDCKGWHGGGGSLACFFCNYAGVTKEELIIAKKKLDDVEKKPYFPRINLTS